MAQIAPSKEAAEVLLGFETSDDAAVYKLSDDLAAVLTLDFFTPVVDDPYEFGAIAAANALSDVFAMGARPVTALNILAFPCDLGTEVVSEVLRGGAAKVAEAGAFMVGGHTIDDDEPKYGLSVMGVAHPDAIISNKGAQPGDVLFYTKRLGTGIMGSAFRAGLETDESMRAVIEGMMTLNCAGAQAAEKVRPHAMTDVTGFGLLGHLHEMLEASGIGARVNWKNVPLHKGVYEHSCAYCRPGKTFGLIEWAEAFTECGALSAEEFDNRMGVLCDPQTSGGLLVAVAPEDADAWAAAFEAATGYAPWNIGWCTTGAAGTIKLR